MGDRAKDIGHPTPRRHSPEHQSGPKKKARPVPAPFVASGFFALRTPLLPFDDFVAWSMGLAAPTAAAEDVEAAVAADRGVLRERLRALLERPEVREAVFVASPSLHESFDHWVREPESDRGQKVEKALVRYFARMAGRSTPFGLFAGCSVGTLADETQLTLGARASYERHTRLDMDYVCALTDALARDPGLRDVLPHRPNTSLYRAAGQMRYAEARLKGKNRSYHLVAVAPTDYLDATLARAKLGALPRDLAAALCVDDPEVGPADAAAYVGELIASQLLVADLAPAVTGPEPLPGLVAQLSSHRAGVATAACLASVQTALHALDAGGLGASADPYLAIAERLKALPADVELPRLFQVDMVKPAPRATLGAAVMEEITRGVTLLHRISPGGRGGQNALSRFREAFERRYEGRLVPLVEVLDEEAGIGFDAGTAPGAEGTPLLEGLAFPGPPGEESARWGAREALLLSKLQSAARTGAQEVALEPAELDRLTNPDRLPLPDAFAAMAVVAAASDEALAAGEFQVHLHHAGGPSGANLLGRFCHGDPALEAAVRGHIAAEEALLDSAVFAEIVHLPEGRIGNVLARPVLRGYELAYLGRSGAPLDQQLAITDLLVGVTGNRVVLRSARLDREVLPRLTTAHNFSSPQNLGVYRFLCAIQYQGIGGAPGWSWGALEVADFLPRVTVGRLVLSRATWHLGRSQLETLTKAKMAAARFAATQEIRGALRLPRYVEVADGDNELPLDLENALSIDTFVELVRNRGGITLVELWPAADRLCARGPDGRFCSEVVVPFVRRPAEETTTLTTGSSNAAPVQSAPSTRAPRSFSPGSEWLYVKLYTGTATAEHVLREVVAPAICMALATGAARTWFFLRYADPDWHLRVRLQGDPGRLLSEVLPALERAAKPVGANGRIWKVQLDTYDREVERYGGDAGIALSERLFHADSDVVLAIVQRLTGDGGADARWRLALRGIHDLLTDLGFDLAERHAIVKRARVNFGQEFHVNTFFERQLGDRFRKERASLEALLDPTRDAGSSLVEGLALLGTRSTTVRRVAASLRAVGVPMADIATSYVHMHANRMLRSAAGAQELVLYDFLSRLYQTQIARAKQRGT